MKTGSLQNTQKKNICKNKYSVRKWKKYLEQKQFQNQLPAGFNQKTKRYLRMTCSRTRQ